MKKSSRKKPRRDRRIVRLEDLAPRTDPTGGAGKVVFGQDPQRSPAERERPPKSTS